MTGLKQLSLLLIVAAASPAFSQWQTPTPGKSAIPAANRSSAHGAKSIPAKAAVTPKAAGTSKGTPKAGSKDVSIHMDGSYESSGASPRPASSGGSVGLSSTLRELQRLEKAVGTGSSEYIREYNNYKANYESEGARAGAAPAAPSEEGLKREAAEKYQQALLKQQEDAQKEVDQKLNEHMAARRKELEKEGFSNWTSSTKPLDTK